jgi:hypothetical protein
MGRERHAVASTRCSRAGCTGPSLCRPSFLFVFTNGDRQGAIEPDVQLCREHGRDLRERFGSAVWRAQFDASLPPGCARVDWARSRMALTPVAQA